jgi:hypothetical protein
MRVLGKGRLPTRRSRRQAPAARLHRVCSVVMHEVKAVVSDHVSIHQGFFMRAVRFNSGLTPGAMCEGTAVTQRVGKSLSGSTGLPCLRISKCSCTRSASEEPISAIFWPRLTLWSSLTSKVWLCAYAVR